MPTSLCRLAAVLAVAALAFVAGVSNASGASLEPQPPHEPKPPATLGELAAAHALRALGVPYRWAGASLESGFDCSGLVYWAYAQVGIEVPHSSYALYGVGKRVSRGNLKPGDVLFFSGLGHVGLYLGNGRMVHAPETGRVVEVVRLARSNYGTRLVGARRIAPG
jgi:cell wall-associated NlpC family hydrolase